jgi:hypothetical protein
MQPAQGMLVQRLLSWICTDAPMTFASISLAKKGTNNLLDSLHLCAQDQMVTITTQGREEVKA